ncbi:predicted protein, partial [Nematostella vectensis]
ELPGVSILKPLAGDELNLAKNLQTFFELSYPKFEILFCVEDELDSAAGVVRQLIRNYPLVNAKLFTGKTVGVNPKINNMNQGYKAARYDYLWICDSGIMVHPNTLREMVSHMSSGVGMVHQIPFIVCASSASFAACVDKVYFGTQHAFLYLFANTMGLLCANGMSTIYNKKVLDELGGLEAFSCYIAEDYFISKAIYNKGHRIAFSSEPAMQNPSKQSLAQFQGRMLRWTRLRLTMEPLLAAFEPFTECLMIGVLASWAVWQLWAFSIVLFFIKHLLLWFLLDFILLRIVQGSNGSLPPLWKLFLAWLFRELFSIVFFLQAACGRHIEWRTTHFKLLLGGKAELIDKCQNADTHCC